MPQPIVKTRVEYALYWLASRHPDVFRDAQEWQPSMLAENQPALAAAKELIGEDYMPRLRFGDALRRDLARASEAMAEASAEDAAEDAPPAFSWVYLSERLPLPLRGKHRCVGTPKEIDRQLEEAAEMPLLAPLFFVVGEGEQEVWVNPAYVVGVTAVGDPDA